MELLELMADLVLQQFREAVKTSARYIKLWENLSIETIGRRHYQRHCVPLYHKIFDILAPADKKLLVHYDGKLRLIREDIAALAIDGIDSFTPPPEGRHECRRRPARFGRTSSCGCIRRSVGIARMRRH